MSQPVSTVTVTVPFPDLARLKDKMKAAGEFPELTRIFEAALLARCFGPTQAAPPVAQPRVWEIWTEGFAATGESGPAHKVGEVLAFTFPDAVRIWYDQHPSPDFNPERLTFWGCRLFPTEAEARASFG